jgi:hypothetical protein
MDDLRDVGAAAAASLEQDGFAVVAGALSVDTVVAGFVAQIKSELALADGIVGESLHSLSSLTHSPCAHTHGRRVSAWAHNQSTSHACDSSEPLTDVKTHLCVA